MSAQTFDILFIGQRSSTTNTKQNGIRSFLADILKNNVDYLSSHDLARRISSAEINISNYDFVVWHYSSPDVDGSIITKVITRLNIPVIVIDGDSFPISKSLGLVDTNAPGSISQFDGSYWENGIYVAEANGYGNAYHFLLQGQEILRYTVQEEDSKLDLEYGQPFAFGNRFSGKVHTVSLRNNSTKSYSRPLLAVGRYQQEISEWHKDEEFEVDLDKVAVIVDDRRRIVASGLFDWQESYQTVDLSTEPGEWPDNRYWDFLHRMVMFVSAASPTLVPIGQNMFAETDLVVPSRGFDFAVKRTYTSATWNLNSYQGPSWTSNHDQYLIWDKYNDRVHLFNGTGRATEMEMVQGDKVPVPAASNPEPFETRTFISIKNGVTDIAVYFPPDNTNPLTRENPFIGEYPKIMFDEWGNPIEPEISATELVTSRRHQTHPDNNSEIEPDDFQSGFLIRDCHGNLAFFAFHPIRETSLEFQSHDILSPADGVVGDKVTRTRKGELGYYRIAYIQDRNGNRQNYYYGLVNSAHRTFFNKMPEDLLWCVVDTEGRGYHFDIQWAEFGWINGKHEYHPWFVRVNTPVDFPNIEYGYSPNSRHGLLLEKVEWLVENSDQVKTIGKKQLGYFITHENEEEPDNEDYLEAQQDWDFVPPLKYVTDKGENIIQQFEYGAPLKDNCIIRFYKKSAVRAYTPGKLQKTISGSLSDHTVTKFFYHLKPGFGDRENLNAIRGWITTMIGGTATTIAFNPHFHIIKQLEWYTVDATPSITYPETVPPCSEWDPDDLEFDPFSNCKGWLHTFETNYDGYVVKENSPSGIVKERRHLIDDVVAYLTSQDSALPMDGRLLEFWKNYWHLRYWLANEVSVTVTGTDGVTKKEHSTRFEPVFNRTIEKYLMGRLTRSQRYDYMEDGHWYVDQFGRKFGMLPHELFEIMHLPHASSNDLWPDFLLNNMQKDHIFFEQIPWLIGGLQQKTCSRSGAPFDFDSETIAEPTAGNLICKTVPATRRFGKSKSRKKASARYGYDRYGRQIYHRNLDAIETIYQYQDNQALPDDEAVDSIYLEKISRTSDRETGHEIIEKQYHDSRGLIVFALKSVDSTVWIYNAHDYDAWGRVVDTEAGMYSDKEGRKAEKRTKFQYDVNGNLVAMLKIRCLPGDEEGCERANQSGRVVRELRAYDSNGRLKVEGHQFTEHGFPPRGIFTFTEYSYDSRDLLKTKRVYSNCQPPIDIEDPEEVQEAIRQGLATGNTEYKIHYEYDGRNLLYREVMTGAGVEPRETIKRYDVEGRIFATRNAEEMWTHKEYDGLGRLVREVRGLPVASLAIDSECIASAYEYDEFDQIIQETEGYPLRNSWETDAAFADRRFHYDIRGTQVAKQVFQYPLGEPSDQCVWTYYEHTQGSKVTSEIVVAPTYEATNRTQYDGLGRVQKVIDGFSHVKVDYVQDDRERVVREIQCHYQEDEHLQPVVTITRYEHNSQGNVVRRILVDSLKKEPDRVYQYVYDRLGYLIKTINPMGHVTTYVRDGQGNEVVLCEHFGEEENGYWKDGEWHAYHSIENRAKYDYEGRVVIRSDAHGYETEYERNIFGEVVKVTRPDKFYKRFTFNRVGVATQIEYPDGRDKVFVLDRFQRPKQIFEDGKLSQTFSYFGNGNLESAVDYNLGNDAVKRVETRRQWSTLGNLLRDETAITDSRGTITNATFADYSGQYLVQLTLPTDSDSQQIKYTYHENYPGQLITVEVGGKPAAQYAWAGKHLIKKTVFGENHDLITSRIEDGHPTYTGFGFLAAQHSYLGTDEQVAQSIHNFEYAYNQNNRLVAERSRDDTEKGITYVLDDLDRVREFEQAGKHTRYDIDEANNIRRSCDADDSSQFTALDISQNGMHQVKEVHEAENQSKQLKYDVAGNITSDRCLRYAWDTHDRLVGVSDTQNSEVAKYGYDALNRRVCKHLNEEFEQIIDYYLFGEDVVEEKHAPLANLVNDTMMVVVHDPTHVDRYLRWDNYEDREGSWHNIAIERLGVDVRNNCIAVIGNNDVVQGLYYDAFGNSIAKLPKKHVVYGFSGRRYDTETDLYYYRTRYYSSRLARFVSVDTYGSWGDRDNYGNGYCYVGNRPNNLIDPYGLQGGRTIESIGGEGNYSSMCGNLTSFSLSMIAVIFIPATGPALIVGAGIAAATSGYTGGSALSEMLKNTQVTVIHQETIENGRVGNIEFKKADVEIFRNGGKLIRMVGDQNVKIKGKSYKVKDSWYFVQEKDGTITGPYIKDEKGDFNTVPKDEFDDYQKQNEDDENPKPDKDSSKKGRSSEEESEIQPEGILFRIRRKMLTGKGGSSLLPMSTENLEDIIQTGGVKDMIRRYSKGGSFDFGGRSPVWVDECGEVHVDGWRLWRADFGLGDSSMQGFVNFLIQIDPNMGGGIDPAPVFTMGGQGLVIPHD